MPEPNGSDISPNTLADLFLTEEARFLHFAKQIVADFAVAQDIVQDAFLQLLRHRDSVANPRPWLFTTIRRLALNHCRKFARVAALDDASDTIPTIESSPDSSLERDEAVLLLRLCMDELLPAEREILQLKFESDLSYEDIAIRTGLSQSNVGYRLHHAVKKVTALYHRAAATGGAAA